MSGTPAILFTAFEPSGDDHAAVVIRELKRRHPDLTIYAWGGPKMRAAGATIIDETGHDAVVGVPGWEKIRQHQRINRDIAKWIAEHPEVELHVPVDSPAANFPICKIAKRAKRKVVHLVAPQLWAWGPWRIKKLRKLTDLVLCLLPFEEPWFKSQGVEARFIGHPLFDEPLDLDALTDEAAKLPQTTHKLAILPGSRPAEIRRNFPVLLSAFRKLHAKFGGEGGGDGGGVSGVVAATTEDVRETLYQRANMLGGWPEGLDIRVGQTDLVARWCDIALVVSGTVTLQLAKQTKPMVIVYKSNEFAYNLIGRRIITTRLFALPNLIANHEAVPEIIPMFKDQARFMDLAERLLTDDEMREAQRLNLRSITARFSGRIASAEASNAIEEILGIGKDTPPHNLSRAESESESAEA